MCPARADRDVQQPEGERGRLTVNLYERLKKYVLASEWSSNSNDGKGPRCPWCLNTNSEGHTANCDLKVLCDDIRTLKRAVALESGE
jgi:hypothetical protein